VTIHDVAAWEEVSVATVSRVLNGKTVAREETLRQVLSAGACLTRTGVRLTSARVRLISAAGYVLFSVA